MLIQCPECELQVSDKALLCPHCGYPMKPDAKPRKPRNSNKRRRLPNGFGQISEIKGRNLRNPFRAMVTVGKSENGRPICKPLKPESYFPTYNDAYAALVEYNKNPYDLDPAITVKELYERWSKEYFETLKTKSHIHSYEISWLYCSAIYNMRVKDIRARHIKGCMKEGIAEINGKKQHANARKQTEIKTLFNLMLDYAVEYEIVEQNFSRSFALSKDIVKEKRKVKQEHIPFTDDEMKILWEHVGEIEGIDTLLIQCYSGWRPQELGLIKIEDVDLTRGTFKGGIKTDAGIDRIVPIHSKIKFLVEQKYNQAKELESEYLFTHVEERNHNYRLTYDRYAKQFRKIKRNMNLNPDHRPHDGRKHFVTMAKKYKVDEYAIKYFVGHAIDDVTERVYTQRDSKWFREEIEKIK